MKILITGINGFIGRYTANAFLSFGASVTGIDRQISCHRDDIPYIQADLTRSEEVKSCAAAKGLNCVIHLAASLEMDAVSTLSVNTLSTYHTLQLALQTGCRHFLHLSSIPVVGARQSIEPVDETTPCNPRTLYHVSKYAAEQLVMLPEFGEMRRYNLRIASPIGPGMPKTFLKIMLEAAKAGRALTLYGTGSRVQNYIDVRDIAAALVQVVQAEPPEGCYLLGGTSCSNREAARLCIAAANQKAELVFTGEPDPFECERWFVDDTKAREAFGYRPKYTLKRSLSDSLE